MRARPAAAKGRFIENITLAASMSPPIKVDVTKHIKIAAAA